MLVYQYYSTLLVHEKYGRLTCLKLNRYLSNVLFSDRHFLGGGEIGDGPLLFPQKETRGRRRKKRRRRRRGNLMLKVSYGDKQKTVLPRFKLRACRLSASERPGLWQPAADGRRGSENAAVRLRPLADGPLQSQLLLQVGKVLKPLLPLPQHGAYQTRSECGAGAAGAGGGRRGKGGGGARLAGWRR